MSDILEEIQALSDKFSNLFEVDGLGNPAVDVPPSQNKIKRDRKTKDGKVEVVSVEDELFPYDGNKREQYRQKIIDIINNMIQGTATLEDLLQFVRQKKAPLKEAMEILEKYTEAQKKSAAEKAFPKRKEELNKVADELDNIMKKNDYEYSGDIHIAQPKGWPYGKSQLNKDVEDKIGEYKRALNRAHAAKKVSEAPLKEAMELMETALTAIRNSGLPKEKQQELTSKLAKGRAKERELADEKAFKSWAKGDRKQLDVQTVRDPEFTKNASGERKTRLRSHSNNYTKSGGRKIKPEWKQVEDSIKRHEKKAKLAEALSLMEEIINEVSERTKIDAYKKRVAQHAERAEHDRNMANEYAKMGGYDHAIDFLKDADASQKKEFKHRLRTMTHDKKFGQDAYNKAQKELFDEWKAKKNIKEALSLMEAVINELNAATVNNALNKRIDQDIEADEKDRVNFNNILKIKDRDERAKAYKDFKKKYDERNAIIDKRMDRYEAYVKRHPEILEEALSLMEAIINEVSLKAWKEAAKNSIDKRKEAAENTAKTAEQSWDDYEEGSRKHPEEEDALYKRAWHNDIVAKKAEQKADHASDVLRIKAKGKSANKTIKAARNSETKRNDEYLQNSDPDKFNRLRTRMMKSDQLITADPVKSRNEVD